MTILDPNDFIYADEISKAPRRPGSKPIDRDNDMKVFDNTKRERPALPDERLPGARLGARKRNAPPGRAAQRRHPQAVVDAGQEHRANMPHVVVWRDRDGNEQSRVFDNRKKARDYGIALNNNGQGQNVRALPEDHPDFQQYANRAQAVTTPDKPGQGGMRNAPGGEPNKDKFLVERRNDEFGAHDVVEFDSKEEAFKYMEREGVRNVGRETGMYNLKLVEPGDAEHEQLRGRARKPNDKELTTGPGTKWLEDEAGADRKAIGAFQRRKHEEARGHDDNKAEKDLADADRAEAKRIPDPQRDDERWLDGRSRPGGPQDPSRKKFAESVERQRMQSKIDQAAAEIVGNGLQVQMGADLVRHGSTGKPYFVHLQNDKDGLDHVMQFPDEEGAIKWVMAHERLQVRAKPDDRVNARIVGGGDTDYDMMGEKLAGQQEGKLGGPGPKKPLPRTTGGGVDLDELAKPGGPLADSAVDRRAAAKADAAKLRERSEPKTDGYEAGAAAYKPGKEMRDQAPAPDHFNDEQKQAYRDALADKIVEHEQAKAGPADSIERKPKPVGNVVRRAVFDERGFREVDENDKTIPPKEQEKPKAKLQIRQNKNGMGRYNVVGRDYKGRQVRVQAKNRAVAEQIKAALQHRELKESDYHGEFTNADRRRKAEVNRVLAGGPNAGNDNVQRAQALADAAQGDKNKPHVAMWFDDKGKHVKVLPNKGEAANFMVDKPAHKDNKILGPADAMYDWNAALDRDYIDNKNAAQDKADADAAMARIAAGEPSPEEVEALSTRRAMGEAMNRQRLIKVGRANDLGGESKNRAGRRWLRARVAAAEGNKDGYLRHMEDFFKAEDELDDPDVIEEVMQRVEDDILGPDMDRLMDAAMANVERWGESYFPGALRQKRAMRAENERMEKERAKAEAEAADRAKAELVAAQNKHIKDHFEAGGGIEDAPDGDLFDVIKTMPERFDVHINGVSGVSPNFWVVDKSKDTGVSVRIPVTSSRRKGERAVKERDIETSNEVWMFKSEASGGGVMAIKDDIMNEVLGVNLQEMLGMKTATGRAATRLDRDNPFFAQRHNDQSRGEVSVFISGNKVEATRWPDGSPWYEHLVDPSELSDMALFDFLIQNFDRHGGNWSGQLVADPNNPEDFKFSIGVYDNGYGFSATRFAHQNDPKSFLAYGKGAGQLKHAKAAFKNDAKYKAALRDFAKRAGQVDLVKLEKIIKDSGASEKQMKTVRAELADLKTRITALESWARSQG